MIVKNPKFKYEVRYVKQGISKNDHPYTRFAVGDYDKRTKKATYINVMAFFHIDLADGDKIIFNDYQVGVHQYNGVTHPTIYISEGDIEVVEMKDDGNTVEVDDLPFDIGKDDLPF